MRLLTAFVLGIAVAVVTELAVDSSETSRVLSSISPLVWTIVAILCVAAVVGLAADEREERRKGEKKSSYLRDS